MPLMLVVLCQRWDISRTLAYALVCSALIHAALVLNLGRLASARDKSLHSEIVQFELLGNSDEISVHSVKAPKRVNAAKKAANKSRALPSKPEVVVPPKNIQDAESLVKTDRQPEAQAAAPDLAQEQGLEASDQGESGTAGVFGRENGVEVSVQERYRRELQAMLEKRKDYPLLAKRLRQQGKVLVRFTLQRDGSVVAAEVIENSQFDSLNQAARKLISEISGLKPFPAEIKRAQWVFVLPVEYRM